MLKEVLKFKIISIIYSVLTVFIIPCVAMFPINILWQLADILMLLMTLPNMISILNFRKMIFDSVRMCKNFDK